MPRDQQRPSFDELSDPFGEVPANAPAHRHGWEDETTSPGRRRGAPRTSGAAPAAWHEVVIRPLPPVDAAREAAGDSHPVGPRRSTPVAWLVAPILLATVGVTGWMFGRGGGAVAPASGSEARGSSVVAPADVEPRGEVADVAAAVEAPPLTSVEVVPGAPALREETAAHATRSRPDAPLQEGDALAPIARAAAAFDESSTSPEPQTVGDELQLRFDSDPPGATVQLVTAAGTRSLGTTPFDWSTTRSTEVLVVRMRLGGYRDWERSLRVVPEARRQLVRASLSPLVAPGQSSMPSDAVDRGEPSASSPPGAPGAPPSSATGTLRISSTPPSELHIDGRRYGDTPQSNIELSAGRHRVTLINPEQRLQRTVWVDIYPGSSVTHNVRMSP